MITKLLKKQKLLYERLKNLHDFYKVKFEICKLGMEARHLDISICKTSLFCFSWPCRMAK